MIIKEEGNKVELILNPLETLLSLSFKRKKTFYFVKKIEFHLDLQKRKQICFKYYIRLPGTCIPFLVKIGTFYRAKNAIIFIISLTMLILSFYFLAIKNFLIFLTLLIISMVILKFSLGEKAFYCINRFNKKAVIYQLIPEKSNNYKELIVGK